MSKSSDWTIDSIDEYGKLTWYVWKKGVYKNSPFYLFTSGKAIGWHIAIKQFGSKATNARTTFVTKEAATKALNKYLDIKNQISKKEKIGWVIQEKFCSTGSRRYLDKDSCYTHKLRSARVFRTRKNARGMKLCTEIVWKVSLIEAGSAKKVVGRG